MVEKQNESLYGTNLNIHCRIGLKSVQFKENVQSGYPMWTTV